MNGLRWILLVAGAVLIGALYIWGRRGRRTAVTESDAPRSHSIPQLDEVIATSKRVIEMPTTIRAESGTFSSDSLPPMHTSYASQPGLTVVKTAPRSSIESREPRISELPASDWSATSDIKAEPTLSESVLAAANFTQTGSQRSLRITSSPEASASGTTGSESVREASPTVDVPEVQHSRKFISKRKIVALRLSAGAIPVEGSRLKSLLEAAGLKHGKYSIYHRMHDGDTALFSVASMVEPGTFDPFAMAGAQFPGVTLFAQLPGPVEGAEVFSQMLSCARELERAVGGILQDERGLPLTEQRVERLREDIADFLHLLKAE